MSEYSDNAMMRVMSTIKAGVGSRQSIMLVGDPGKGKSAVVRQLADEMGYGLIIIVGSQRDATDITGFPVKKEVPRPDGKGTTDISGYAPPEWQYRIQQEKRIILFLDEFSNSTPPVQASMLTLLNEREFSNGERMPEETVIIGAMNPVATAANGFELGLPVCNRLMFVPWEPSEMSWCKGLESNWGHPERVSKTEMQWRGYISRFIQTNPALLYKLPSTDSGNIAERSMAALGVSTPAEEDIFQKAYPTNRSWTNLAKTIPYCRNEEGKISLSIIDDVARGLIGAEASIKFLDFFKNVVMKKKNALPPSERILEDPSIMKWDSLDAAMGHQAVSGIVKVAESDTSQTSNLVKVFIHIANERGTDLGAPYIQKVISLASSQRLPEKERRPLMKAYADIGNRMFNAQRQG